MKLYINNFEDLKILKKKKPLLRWASREDILNWYPAEFPFIAFISSYNRMTYSTLGEEDDDIVTKAIINSRSFLRSKKSLEIE
jgi:hypothetical protein